MQYILKLSSGYYYESSTPTTLGIYHSMEEAKKDKERLEFIFSKLEGKARELYASNHDEDVILKDIEYDLAQKYDLPYPVGDDWWSLIIETTQNKDFSYLDTLCIE